MCMCVCVFISAFYVLWLKANMCVYVCLCFY